MAEFLASRELYPTRVATNNAAIALRKLQRYDEALDMFETFLRDFEVPPRERKEAQKQLTELRALVGTIDIVGAEAGASIVVGSVDRGEYPPVKPIRVAAGTHVVRLFKEGYEPFETRIDVAGGSIASVEAKLARLMPALHVGAIDEPLGRRAGVLLGRARKNDVIDAAVVLLASDGDVVLTSDPRDLKALADAAGIHVDLVLV